MSLLLKEAISTSQCQTRDPQRCNPSMATTNIKLLPLTLWSRIRTPKEAPKLLPLTVRTITPENCRRLASQSTRQTTSQMILVTLSRCSLTLRKCWWWGSSSESSVIWTSIKKILWKFMRRWFKLGLTELEPSDASKKSQLLRTKINRVNGSN